MTQPDTATLPSPKARGIELFARREFASALPYFEQGLAEEPDSRELWNFKARTLEGLGRLEESLACVECALKLAPRDIAELSNRAHLLARLLRPGEALLTLDQVLQVQPTHVGALIKRALLLFQVGKRDEALAAANRAVEADPKNLEAFNTRGMLFDDLGRRADAKGDYDWILGIDPNYADTLTNLAIWHARAGEFSEALACYNRSLSINPNQLNAVYNQSVVKLVLGDWTQGFREFESRWTLFPHEAARLTKLAPLWTGDTDIRGKTVLLHHEQGFGDTLQFCRYAILVKNKGAQVVLAVPAALRRLLQTLPGGLTVVGEGEAIPAHELHCPLMSLPRAFGTTPATAPASVPYLQADSTDVKRWRAQLGEGTRSRVGIVWSGRRYPPINHARDTTLQAIRPLLASPVDFVCLHTELSDEERITLADFPNVAWYGDQLTDFADTAGLIMNLDLIITVDSAVAHLAGALGKPVWLMNRFASCWRWLLERKDSPWYPSLRLFRQKTLGDWAGVVADVHHALTAFTVLRRAAPVVDSPLLLSDSQSAVDSKLQQALDCHRNGDRQRAIEVYTALLRKAPDQADVHHYLGIALSQEGRHAEALGSFERAALLQPASAAVHSHRGNALAGLMRFNEAIKAYDRSITCDPAFAESHYNQGVSFAALNLGESALTSYARALALNPSHAQAHNNRGSLFLDQGRLDDALASFERALVLQPAFLDALVNRAHVLRRTHRYAESLASAQAAVAADGTSAPAHNSVGAALADMGRYNEARASYERAASIDPCFPEARWNLGLCKLSSGDLAEGWKDYEWRWQVKSLNLVRRFSDAPQLKATTPLAGKVVWLHAEQGYGDTIQFCRYATCVAQRGARVMLSVPNALKSLMATVAGVENVIDQAQKVPAFDVQCSLMSLPQVFNSTLVTLPAPRSYLAAEPSARARWARSLKDSLGAPKVGLAWSGRATHHNDRNRSIPLQSLAHLVTHNAHWVSLQKEMPTADLAALGALPVIERAGERVTDFADTAALIENLDLVISADTAIAHLAAALGKPTWILLPYVADWRWFQERLDSPWYPTVTLFRQTRPQDWSDVIDQVAVALDDWLDVRWHGLLSRQSLIAQA